MKLSEVTEKDIAAWCHVAEDDPRLPIAWAAASMAVRSHTGLSEAKADEYPGLTVAALIIAADTLYNTLMHVDNDKLNQVVGSFLSLHDRNLLPGEAKA